MTPTQLADLDNPEFPERSPSMDNRPAGVSHTVPPLERVAVILELIDRVLADHEPQLVQQRTAVDDPSTPRRPFPVVVS